MTSAPPEAIVFSPNVRPPMSSLRGRIGSHTDDDQQQSQDKDNKTEQDNYTTHQF